MPLLMQLFSFIRAWDRHYNAKRDVLASGADVLAEILLFHHGAYPFMYKD